MNEVATRITPSLDRYDAMISAIAECARVDEVKDLRDKAMALEAYYRQARNLEAEREAANVRLRAERRAGELLKELARADYSDAGKASGVARSNVSTGKTRSNESPFAAALSDTGMSRQTAHQFQALASIPEQEFEEALAVPAKPSRAAILKKAKPEPEVSDEALWLWGRLRDFERRGYLEQDFHHPLRSMTEGMAADVARLAPIVAAFLNDLEI